MPLNTEQPDRCQSRHHTQCWHFNLYPACRPAAAAEGASCTPAAAVAPRQCPRTAAVALADSSATSQPDGPAVDSCHHAGVVGVRHLLMPQTSSTNSWTDRYARLLTASVGVCVAHARMLCSPHTALAPLLSVLLSKPCNTEPTGSSCRCGRATSSAARQWRSTCRLTAASPATAQHNNSRCIIRQQHLKQHQHNNQQQQLSCGAVVSCDDSPATGDGCWDLAAFRLDLTHFLT